jgi:hypothetical protein
MRAVPFTSCPPAHPELDFEKAKKIGRMPDDIREIYEERLTQYKEQI